MKNKSSNKKRAEAFNSLDEQCINSKKKTVQRALQFVLDWIVMVFPL